MATVKVVPRSLTDAYKRREGDFSPNLVGFQFTDGVSLFTFGNFQITTNFDSKINKNFVLGGQWSDYYSLDNLNLTENQSEILMSNDLFIRLNFDINKINRYVYFGSFQEFARVTIEQIIQKWKGSLYLNPLITNTPVNTVLSFNYNPGIDESTFLIPKSVIQNPYELITIVNQDFANLQPDDIFNLSRDYEKYVIWNNFGEFKVIGYTGDTPSFPYLRVQTEGNPFPTLTASTFGQLTYHVKPNNTEVELFFNTLDDFESILLNRLTTPIYTSSFSVPQEANGFIVFNQKRLSWPVSDGYNLDINTREYALYVEEMLNMATLFDQYKTDLVARKFVAESINEYDTNGGGDETYGRKVNKLLRIYGREFDEVKKYIDGISFANVVTYNKLDNTSDELIKIIAKNLGFDTLLTVGTDNFNLLEQIQPSYQTAFSGYSRSLTSKELDIELWRRLVINAWWLFRSKGTRKVIEFFFKLFNIPECMVSLNEYIYLASNRLDTIKVFEQLASIYQDPSLIRLGELPMDDYGFPRILPETNDNYFQMDGFWYNGGNESTVGNNPHIGPYDYGRSYMSQFECFVPNFADFLTASTSVIVNKNYFNNFNKGSFIFDQTGLPVPYYGTAYANTLNNNNLVNNAVVNSAGLTYVGGNNSPKYGVPSGDTYSMKINFTAGKKEVCQPCALDFVYGQDGIVYVKGNPNTPLRDATCCQNYWLPTTSNTTVCPSTSSLQMTVEGYVTYNGGPLSQQCCNRTVTGSDVYWDGRNCVINHPPPPSCPDPTSLQITVEGYVTYNGGPLPQQCCTIDVVGSRAYWDGRNCVIGDNLGGGNLGGDLGTEYLNKTFVFNSADLFAIGTEPPVEVITYNCYWCPPNDYIQTICSADEYVMTLSDTDVVNLAISLGANQGISVKDAQSFVLLNYSSFFTTYGCLLLDNLDKPIGNLACCQMKGGTWTSIGGKYYCVKPQVNPCASNSVNNNHVVVDSNGGLISQTCCPTLGYEWTNGSLTVIDSVTNQVRTDITIQDTVGLSFANSLGTNNFCTACPTQITIVNDCTGGGCVSVVKKYNSSSAPTQLTQQCCTDYGFSWDSTNSRCLYCPSVVNYGTPLNDYLITDLGGNDLSQQCCEAIGGWYGNAFNEGDKCYTCAGVMIFDSNGNGVANPDYQITGSVYPLEVKYKGNSLTQQCCTQYNAQFGLAVWDSITNKCLINS